jgi:hypothetical protein
MIRVALKTARRQGAMPLRIATEEQHRRRAVFSATPRAAVLWAPAGVARSTSIRPIQALRSRLARCPNPKWRASCYFRVSTLVSQQRKELSCQLNTPHRYYNSVCLSRMI